MDAIGEKKRLPAGVPASISSPGSTGQQTQAQQAQVSDSGKRVLVLGAGYVVCTYRLFQDSASSLMLCPHAAPLVEYLTSRGHAVTVASLIEASMALGAN